MASVNNSAGDDHKYEMLNVNPENTARHIYSGSSTLAHSTKFVHVTDLDQGVGEDCYVNTKTTSTYINEEAYNSAGTSQRVHTEEEGNYDHLYEGANENSEITDEDITSVKRIYASNTQTGNAPNTHERNASNTHKGSANNRKKTVCKVILIIIIIFVITAVSATLFQVLMPKHQDINDCTSGPCKNDGKCADKVNGYNCTCDEGYTGINCETDINECTSRPCKNGGDCEDKVNGYTCSCKKGYKGINCEHVHCENGWVQFDRSCYLFKDFRRRIWTEAEENCRSLSSHLVIIKSAEENNFLKQQLANRNPDETDVVGYWTAGNDRQAENQWVWGNTGDRVILSFWHRGEPNSNGNEDCLTFYGRYDYAWNDYNCDKSMFFICEVEY